MIRYKVCGVAKLLSYEEYGCGHVHLKMSWMKRRLDNMTKVRGLALHPLTIEKVTM